MLFSPSGTRRKRLQLQISERRLLLMFGDFVASVTAVLIALFIWSRVAQYRFDAEFVLPQLGWFFLLPALWLALAGANSFYDLPVAANRLISMQKLVVITLQMLVVYLLVFFFSDRTSLPRLFIVYYGVSAFVLVALWRLLNPALIGWASTPRHIYVVGTDWAAETIIETLKQSATQSYEVMGVISDGNQAPKEVAGVPVVGTASSLASLLLRDQIRELVVTSTRELDGATFQAVMDAYERGVVVTPMPILYERVTERVPVEHVGDNWAIVLPVVNDTVLNPYPLLKRGLDVFLAGLGLAVFLVLLPFFALAIKLDSRGPIFYTQSRVGLHGRLFRIIKFRTMVQDAEKVVGAVFAQANDPRITRVGRFLRKTRLDEIPQLINIFSGDMSLLGPRPERPEHVQRLQEKIPFYRTRHVVRPGLTGWAQVRYKYGANDEDALIKLQYDLYYIRHQSILLDINILIRTVGKVLGMGGQ
jgi:exopolysaccharide biosynthesis polyprenyl glycosylphosphotransferase